MEAGQRQQGTQGCRDETYAPCSETSSAAAYPGDEAGVQVLQLGALVPGHRAVGGQRLVARQQVVEALDTVVQLLLPQQRDRLQAAGTAACPAWSAKSRSHACQHTASCAGPQDEGSTSVSACPTPVYCQQHRLWASKQSATPGSTRKQGWQGAASQTKGKRRTCTRVVCRRSLARVRSWAATFFSGSARSSGSFLSSASGSKSPVPSVSRSVTCGAQEAGSMHAWCSAQCWTHLRCPCTLWRRLQIKQDARFAALGAGRRTSFDHICSRMSSLTKDSMSTPDSRMSRSRPQRELPRRLGLLQAADHALVLHALDDLLGRLLAEPHLRAHVCGSDRGTTAPVDGRDWHCFLTKQQHFTYSWAGRPWERQVV